jgi:Vacuolar protein sorting-associated protein
MSLSDILYAPLQRFYTFVLKKLIGDYLKDELHHRQLEVEIRNGIVELQNIELDVEVTFSVDQITSLHTLHQVLNDSISGLPFSIVKATVSKIRAEIPWHSLSKKNCKIILTVAGNAQPRTTF